MRRLSMVLVGVLTILAAGDLSAQTEISARKASLRIGGRLHTQYASSSVGDYKDQFFFRRARLTADITVNDFLTARIQPEFAGGSAELKDAYVRLSFDPLFRVSMGQFKRAFDLFELSSSTDLSLIERDGRVGGVSTCTGVGGVCSYSRFTEKLSYADRDQGIRIQGSRGKVEYEATMTNGAGANESDENDTKSYSGRLSVDVADNVTVSGQFAAHDYVGVTDNDEYASAWSLDVAVGSWRDGVHFQAALAGGDNWKSLDGAGDPATFLAFQGVASYFAPLSSERFTAVEPLLRLSYGDPNTNLNDDGGLVVTPGLMFYVAGKNKIGANVDIWSPQTGDTEYSFKLQSFLYF